jgi:hypothetical protein
VATSPKGKRQIFGPRMASSPLAGNGTGRREDAPGGVYDFPLVAKLWRRAGAKRLLASTGLGVPLNYRGVDTMQPLKEGRR